MTVTPEDAKRLEECLVAGGVAVIPTDTVYGLACDPGDAAAIQKIYALKGRPPLKPSAVLFFSFEAALEALPDLGTRTRAALAKLLPGPVTLLLPNPQRHFRLACDPAGEGSAAPLGLRVPLLESSVAALVSIRVPVLQSSANLSGEAPPRRLADVPAALRKGADLVLDGGELPGLASNVIDLSTYEQSGDWRIVREGPLDAASLATALTRSW